MLRTPAHITACLLFTLAACEATWGAAPPRSLPQATVRPIGVARPIFALPASSSRAAAASVAASPAQPLHRRPPVSVPKKTPTAPTSATAVNPAPPPIFGSSAVPMHRRALGW
jgi:hypothetical protein